MKFGLHINSSLGIDTWIPKFKNSPVHLVLAGSAGGEINRTSWVADTCPNSLIVYRAWKMLAFDDDSSHFEWYYKTYGTNPMPAIDVHRSVIDGLRGKRVTIQFFNETGMDDELWPAFVEFNTRLLQVMNTLGQSTCIFGAGPGYPTGERPEIFEKWKRASSLFDLINHSPVQHYINLHEYFGFPVRSYTPWLFGRFTWLLEDLAKLGLLTDRIKIISGENSWADPAVLDKKLPPNPANGYRGFLMKGITVEQLVDDLVMGYRQVYDPNPHFVGACHFCIDNLNSWPDFNLLNQPDILERIYQKMADIPPVTDTPETAFKVTADTLNVRFAPTLTGQVITQKHAGDVIKTNGFVANDGWQWRQLTNSGGYCAEVNLTDPAMRFLEEVVDWKTVVRNKLTDIRTDLEDVQELISQAP